MLPDGESEIVGEQQYLNAGIETIWHPVDQKKKREGGRRRSIC